MIWFAVIARVWTEVIAFVETPQGQTLINDLENILNGNDTGTTAPPVTPAQPAQASRSVTGIRP